MLKKSITYLLIALLMFNITAYQCIYVYFKANQNYIAQNLCVKKEIKGNSCQGKCHLKKMAKSAESGNKATNEVKVEMFCNSVYSLQVVVYGFSDLDKFVSNEITHHPISGFISGVFAPPEFHFSF